MNKTGTLITVLFSLISVSISSVFTVYGLSLTFGGEMPFWVHGIALYGLGALIMLALAWSKFTQNAQLGMKIISIIPVAVFIFASLDVGQVSGLEWVSIFIITLMVFVNWYMVRLVSNVKNLA